METLLLLGVIVALVIGWIYLRDRLSEMDRRINTLASEVYARPRAMREMASRQSAAEPPAAPAAEVVAAAPPVAAPVVVTPLVAETAAPVPGFAEVKVEERRSSEEWEALLGGNWLNKLGVFVLVIGLALLLGYSFKHLGPWGIDAICVAIGLGMLGTGVTLEGRERYRTFARGLVGGGWAALYFRSEERRVGKEG